MLPLDLNHISCFFDGVVISTPILRLYYPNKKHFYAVVDCTHLRQFDLKQYLCQDP